MFSGNDVTNTWRIYKGTYGVANTEFMRSLPFTAYSAPYIKPDLPIMNLGFAKGQLANNLRYVTSKAQCRVDKIDIQY